MIQDNIRYCDGCRQPLPPSAKLGQQTMSPEEARQYGITSPPDTDGTVTIDLCLACRIRRAESLKNR